MSYSLLYKHPEKERGASLPSDLLLDDTLRRVCKEDCGYFARTVSSVLTDIENIEYRRAIISDLRADPGLTERLKKAFGRYDRMREDWAEMRAGAPSRRPDRANAEAALAASWSSVKATAAFPAALLSFIRGIADALDGDLKSEGLRRLRERCGELTEGGLLTELSNVADRFRGTSPETHGLELLIDLCVDFESAAAEITGVFELKEKKKRGFSVFSKKAPDPDGGVTEADAVLLAADAMYRLDRVTSDVTDRIYSELYGLSRELCFYECAIKLIGFLEEKGACVYPELVSDGDTAIDGLYDLRLLCMQDVVTPCDFKLADCTPGLIIRGANGAGKTTFLRSVGTAYLLCQAGLPIPAGSARVVPVSGICAVFSSAEEDFMPGDTAGRFEGEVRAMSDLLSHAGRGSLIFMNEPFQSTGFDEGARALRGILTVLPEAGIKYLLVTHLAGLSDSADIGADRLEFGLNKHDYIILEGPKK